MKGIILAGGGGVRLCHKGYQNSYSLCNPEEPMIYYLIRTDGGSIIGRYLYLHRMILKEFKNCSERRCTIQLKLEYAVQPSGRTGTIIYH